MTPPIALTIAGSDPGGGAGLQADLRTFSALGVHGVSVVAVITVQDSAAVHRVHPLEANLVREQLWAVTADLPPVASKAGLLASRANIEVVADAAGAGLLGRLVVDPVLRASTGAELTPEGLAGLYCELLLPAAAVVTPNLAEAAWLTGDAIPDRDAMRRAAGRLVELGARAAVVTGGHLETGTEVVDVLAHDGGADVFSRPRIATPNTHGTGCTFSAAVAAHLARGLTIPDAVEAGGAFVARALAGATSWRLGSGPGPLDQLGAGG